MSRFYPNALSEKNPANPSSVEDRLRQVQLLMNSCQDEYHGRHDLGTLYSGGLGPCIYLPLRYAECIAGSDASLASTLLESALHRVRQSLHRYEKGERSRSTTDKPRVTLLTSPWVGAKALEIAILERLGRSREARKHGTELLCDLDRACQNALNESHCEVLYGRAGVIHAILFIRHYIKESDLFGTELVVRLASEIVTEGRRAAVSSITNKPLPLCWKWHEKTYLGAAHGVIGILHTLLCLSPHELSQVDAMFQQRLKLWIRQTIDATLDDERYSYLLET